MKTLKQINSNLRIDTTSIDTFPLSQQEMRTKSSRGDTRQKEDSAVNQLMYMARKASRPGYEYNSTVSQLMAESKARKPILPGTNFLMASNGNSSLLAELENPLTTKTRKKKIRKALRTQSQQS
jgi:hypothetical protein